MGETHRKIILTLRETFSLSDQSTNRINSTGRNKFSLMGGIQALGGEVERRIETLESVELHDS